MANDPKFIVVVGASAGGGNALTELVMQFHEEIDAAIFIVLHLSRTTVGNLLKDRLQQLTPLPCKMATDGTPIEKGTIYFAVPDKHLIIDKGIIKTTHGAVENRWRPSINVLFRSAAVSYTSRVIGIILTGMLDDGTSGMLAIAQCKGTTIVQDPNEAEYPDMPLSVLDNMEVDYSIPISQIGYMIMDIIEHKELEEVIVPEELKKESKISGDVITRIDAVREIGTHSNYACPDCGGGLWELDHPNGQKEFRCHVGHSYSLKDLADKQYDQIENTLWVALRMMEERYNLLYRMATDEEKRGLQSIAKAHKERAMDMRVHIDQIKGLLHNR